MRKFEEMKEDFAEAAAAAPLGFRSDYLKLCTTRHPQQPPRQSLSSELNYLTSFNLQ
jgi:hypothetical protein